VTGKPEKGERVIIDANTLADLLLAPLAPPASPRARAAMTLHERCCSFVVSKKLQNETLTAVHRRGIRVPRATVLSTSEELEHQGKLTVIPSSRLAGRSFEPLAERAFASVPVEDRHIVELALGEGIRWILTADAALLACEGHEEIAARIRFVDSRLG